MAGALVRALIAHVDSTFDGPNGDYPAALEAIDGLTAQQAAWKPAPAANSIWQIVDHLTASKEWQIDMLEQGQAEPRPWIEPPGGEEAWQALVLSSGSAHEAHHSGQLSYLRGLQGA